MPLREGYVSPMLVEGVFARELSGRLFRLKVVLAHRALLPLQSVALGIANVRTAGTQNRKHRKKH